MKNRIKDHRRVRAGDLVPHELNPRTHTEVQRVALQALYDEIGFARSLLAYELPDGRLKLIDGHLRRDLTPEEVLDVEVLDVSDAEARALLLAIDPLAQLAGYDERLLGELRQRAEQDSAAVKSLWQTLEEAERKARARLRRDAAAEEVEPRFFVLVVCADEEEQTELLSRFQEDGLKCEAKMG
jgi:GNAT superfamily N-acetyltransferase